MAIELVPALDPDDLAFLAAEAAIERTGLADAVRPAGNTSAWWRAGVHEAVELGIATRERGRKVAIDHPQTGTARERPSRPDAPGSA